MKPFSRGISPDLLLAAVRNTMPYLFENEEGGRLAERFPPARTLREFERAPSDLPDHLEYYRLCLSSHYLTCGTPVPTDVDNQIRRKLWPAELPLATVLAMTELVLASRDWDFTLVSSRFVYGAAGSPVEREPLSGHFGEWFTVSGAAYAALGNYADPAATAMRSRVFDAIVEVVEQVGLEHTRLHRHLRRSLRIVDGSSSEP